MDINKIKISATFIIKHIFITFLPENWDCNILEHQQIIILEYKDEINHKPSVFNIKGNFPPGYYWMVYLFRIFRIVLFPDCYPGFDFICHNNDQYL